MNIAIKFHSENVSKLLNIKQFTSVSQNSQNPHNGYLNKNLIIKEN